jgi:hypothetical protein
MVFQCDVGLLHCKVLRMFILSTSCCHNISTKAVKEHLEISTNAEPGNVEFGPRNVFCSGNVKSEYRGDW